MTTADASVLRPLNMGQLLDRALRLYRRHFGTFISIIAIMLVPTTLIQAMATIISIPTIIAASDDFARMDQSADPMGAMLRLMGSTFGPTFLTLILNFVLVQGLATVAMVRAVANNYLGGEIGVLDAYGRSISDWMKFLGVLIVGAILMFVISLVPCLGWGIGIYFGYVLYPLIAPIVVLERRGVDAIRRAWDLARRRFWWMLGFMLLLYLFAMLIISGPAALINMFTSFLTNSTTATDLRSSMMLSTGIQNFTTLITSLLYLPLQIIAVTLVYFDLRVRTEGFDLTMLAAQEEGAVSEAAPLAQAADAEEESERIEAMIAQAPAPSSDNLVTGNELMSFVGVALAGFVLFIVLYAVFAALGLAVMGAAGGF